MPYVRDKDLPKEIQRDLPRRARSIWRNVFNQVLRRTGREKTAFRSAWGAVTRAGYEKDEKTGRWAKTRVAEKGHRPPLAVRENVRKGWDLQRQDGQPRSCVVCSADLEAGRTISLSKLCELQTFFAERVDAAGEGVEWFLAGGAAGRDWIETVLKSRSETEGGTGMHEKMVTCEVLKQDGKPLVDHGIVFGRAVICRRVNKSGDWEDYYDEQEDHVPEDVMLDMAVDFMKGANRHRVQHGDADIGSYLFAFPLTAEIAKAYEIDSKHTGLLVGAYPEDEAVLEDYRTGRLTGFSIRGMATLEVEA